MPITPRKIRVSAATAAKVRKLAAKSAEQKKYAEETSGLAAGAVLGASSWQPHDYQIRQTALDTAARVLGGTTTSPGVVLKAAETFYAFLTGK